ncbi:hypothetical protein [Desulforhopalus sp. 52FAK]
MITFTIVSAKELAVEVKGDTSPDGVGWLERINTQEREVVINDRLLLLTGETKFFTVDGKLSDKSSFSNGMTVQYLLEDNIVLALWHENDTDNEHDPESQADGAGVTAGGTQKKQGTETLDTKSAPDGSGFYQLENGVWTN